MKETITYVMQLNDAGIDYLVEDSFWSNVFKDFTIETDEVNGKTYAFFEGGPSGLTINDAEEFAEFAGFIEGTFDSWGYVEDPDNELLQFLKDEELIAA
jgi:hypothetical protein